MRGGWFGRGPAEGTVKRILPEGPTDFVFAVAAEEFGIALCLVLLLAVLLIVLRALLHALRNNDPFQRFAAAGLAILFGSAIRHQHGGEPAPDSGQGHDLALHFLWGFLDDLARLGAWECCSRSPVSVRARTWRGNGAGCVPAGSPA